MSARAMIAAGNWKMNGLPDALDQVRAIAGTAGELPGITTLLCLPATLIAGASGIGLPVGGQDCHAAAKGAHTGDLSAEMLAAAGAGYVIVGHSERRADHGETSEMVATKAQAAWRAGLTAIVCIGETDDENRAGQTLDVLRAQIAGSLPPGATADNTILAYEPVWAIGTGRTPGPEDIGRTHGFIRAELSARGARAIPVLYGGSVNAGNAAEIFAVADVDGGLVGGASLKAADFVPIMKALAASGENT